VGKEIRGADRQQVEAQVNSASIVAGSKEYKLYTPKYESCKQMVSFELDFAVSAAERYVSLHMKFRELGYGREEMLKLMRQLGWRKVQLCLRSSTKKMGYRAMKAHLEEVYYAKDRQFNFNMRSDSTAAKLEKALKPFGLTYSQDGRRGHMTEAMEEMLDDYFALKRQVSKTSKTTTNKRVKAA